MQVAGDGRRLISPFLTSHLASDTSSTRHTWAKEKGSDRTAARTHSCVKSFFLMVFGAIRSRLTFFLEMGCPGLCIEWCTQPFYYSSWLTSSLLSRETRVKGLFHDALDVDRSVDVTSNNQSTWWWRWEIYRTSSATLIIFAGRRRKRFYDHIHSWHRNVL